MRINHDTSRDIVNGFLGGDRKGLVTSFEQSGACLDIRKADGVDRYEADVYVGDEKVSTEPMVLRRGNLLLLSQRHNNEQMAQMFSTERGEQLAEGSGHTAAWWREHYEKVMSQEQMIQLLRMVDAGIEADINSENSLDCINYKAETEAILKSMSKENRDRLFGYERCELELDFVAFLHSYKDLAEQLPKDFTIIDIGANQAAQSEYFKDFAGYIAVEPFVEEQGFVRQMNMDIFMQTGEQFIAETLPKLQAAGLDLNKTFCISSYVPDDELRDKLIPQTFPHYRCTYAGLMTHERMPKEGLERSQTKTSPKLSPEKE